jgi:hypothetical protein
MTKDKDNIGFVIAVILVCLILVLYACYFYSTNSRNNKGEYRHRDYVGQDFNSIVDSSYIPVAGTFRQSYYEGLTHKPVIHPYDKLERDSLLKVLCGEWIRLEYYKNLVRTKSPYKAIKNEEVYDGVYIHIFSDSSDVNAFGMYLLNGFHDSGINKYAFEKNVSMVFYGDYDKVQLLPQKNHLLITTLDGKSSWEYIKFNPFIENLNNLIITGEYINEFDTNHENVSFNSNGTVQGLDSLISYEIVTDTFMLDFDTIIFSNGYNQLEYIFNREDKYLNIYKSDSQEEDGVVMQQTGKHLYRLKRIADAK